MGLLSMASAARRAPTVVAGAPRSDGPDAVRTGCFGNVTHATAPSDNEVASDAFRAGAMDAPGRRSGPRPDRSPGAG
ncbi:hypothetical protein NGM37_35570, partial [Streptomyces sp. TRM76130]|nr:hypothetical protein [Streptomyces sp. TRM76130]